MESVAKASDNSQHLSQEELKAKLFLKLKEDGTFNGFRALLRNELVKHLYLIEPQKVLHLPKIKNDEELLVRYPLESTNWLISEHLMRNHYDFTLSVFALESGMPSNRQNLSIGDILSFLQIDPGSEVGHRILDAYKAKEDRFFLWTLLAANKTKFWMSNEDSENQSVLPVEDDFKRVEEKLQKIDDAYDFKKQALRQEEQNTAHSLAHFEQVLRAPERHGAQKLHQFRDIALESFHDNKLREFQGEVDQLRRTLEEQHRYKLHLLIDREKSAQENLEKQKTTIESDFFGYRQKMLLEMTKQQQREEEWENKRHFQEKMLQIEMERMESMKEAIRNREECLKQQEDAHGHWLAEQKQQIEATICKKYDAKQREFDQRELELKSFQERLDAKEMLLKEKDSAHEKAVKSANEIKFDLANAKEQLKALQDENASLRIHANATNENIRLKAELQRLQLLNKEAIARNETEEMRHNTILQEFLDRLAKPSPQALFLQQELDKLREVHQRESEAWYKQKVTFESANFKARTQLSTYSERMKMQNRQIAILHQTVDDLQRGILNKISDSEIPQKRVTFNQSAPTSKSRHEAAYKSWREMPTIDFHGTYFDTSLNPSHLPPELELGVSGLLTESYDFSGDADFNGLTSGLQFSEESFDQTRARIKHLEEEAERLERTFKSFKQNSSSLRFLNRNVPQTVVQNMSTFSDIERTFGRYYVSSNFEDNNRQEPSNLEDFSRQVSSSTPNESAVTDYNAMLNSAQRRFQLKESQESEPVLNKNSKTLKQDTTKISMENDMVKNPINRRLSFELNEAKINEVKEAKPAQFKNTDIVYNKALTISSVISSENTGEIKLQEKSLPESNKILPGLDHKTALGSVQGVSNFEIFSKSIETIPKTAPINLDSAWKSTTEDFQYDFGNSSTIMTANENSIKLNMDLQPKQFSVPGIPQEELIQERALALDHDFAIPVAAYDSSRHIGNIVDNDKADSEGHLSWEGASLKSNNGDDFEW